MPLSKLTSKKPQKEKKGTSRTPFPTEGEFSKIVGAVKRAFVVVTEVSYTVAEEQKWGLDFTNVVSSTPPEEVEGNSVYCAAEYMNLEDCLVDSLQIYNLNITKGAFRTEGEDGVVEQVSKNVITMIASAISQSLYFHEGFYPSLRFQCLPYSTRWSSDKKLNEAIENCISLRILEVKEGEEKLNFDEIVTLRRQNSQKTQKTSNTKTVVKKTMPEDL